MSSEADSFDSLVQSVRVLEAGGSIAPGLSAKLAADVSDGAIAQRKAAAVKAGAGVAYNVTGPNPKQAFRVVLCKLSEDSGDPDALAYIPVGLGFRSKGDTFGKSALSRIYCQFGDRLPEKIRSEIFEEVTTYEGWLTGGTENHIAMRRTAGFLFGEAFPDAEFHGGLTGQELADVCLTYFKDYGRALFRNSMVEFLSPIYHAVHTAAWLNIVEFAKDSSAVLSARAILDYMLADLAVNCHNGIIIPPAARAKGLMTDSYQLSTVRSNTQWTAWLYWGAGNVEASYDAISATGTWEKGPLSLHAVSGYSPEPVIRNIGAKHLATPYSLLQSRTSREAIASVSDNPHWKREPMLSTTVNPRYCTRSVYVNRDYAIGAGARAADIDEPTIRHSHIFGVIWKDEAPRNWMFLTHPYWYPRRSHDVSGEPLGADDWSGTSPFLQMVHWQNAAVLLLDLPERDPYYGRAVGNNPKWISDRPERPLPYLNAFIPDTMDEIAESESGVFLRAGNVYIGIRPIGGALEWRDTVRAGYRKLTIEGMRIGTALEVGDAAEYESFVHFQATVSDADLDTSRLTVDRSARYQTTRGHELSIQHNPDDWRPYSAVNGVSLDYDAWPTCESPYVTCREGVMDVNDGSQGFSVDWQGELPEYRYYDVT